MIETIRPQEIERRSFEIIGEMLQGHPLAPEHEAVIKRVIHTTADFDYADNLVFSAGAVEKGVAALRSGCDIVTDTQMARAGINNTALARLGGQVHCFMSDPDVAQEAQARGVTRADRSGADHRCAGGICECGGEQRADSDASDALHCGPGPQRRQQCGGSDMHCTALSDYPLKRSRRKALCNQQRSCGTGIPPAPARQLPPGLPPGCC